MVALLAAACGTNGTDEAEEPDEVVGAEELTEVSIRLDWFHGGTSAGVYLAQEYGYFEDEGLSVEINAGGPDRNPITLVAQGEDDFGTHDGASLIMAHAEGLPLVTVAEYFQQHPGGVVVRADSGIETLEDFEGANLRGLDIRA